MRWFREKPVRALILAIGLLVTGVLPSMCWAGFTFFESRVDWENAAIAAGLQVSLETFNSFPASDTIPSFTIGSTTFTPGAHSGAVAGGTSGAGPFGFPGTLTLTLSPITSISFGMSGNFASLSVPPIDSGSISSGYYGIGIDVGVPGSGVWTFPHMTLWDDLGSGLTPVGDHVSLSTGPVFLGYLSDVPVDVGVSWLGSAVMDNLVVAAQPVPEPSTLALLGVGLLSIFGFCRRKNGTKSP